MHINAVMSSMGAWKTLNVRYGELLKELQQALGKIGANHYMGHAEDEVIGRIHQTLDRELECLGWRTSMQVRLTGAKRTFYTLDFIKEKVGGKLSLGKQAAILSTLLAHFPLSVQVQDVELGILLLPMHDLKRDFPKGTAAFEATERILEELAPMLIRYPFLVLGFSSEPSVLHVRELTSDLDQLLLKQVGHTLNEMLVLGERPEYDFKVQLPERTDAITKEVCAMANSKGGGVLLFGISDEGEVIGIHTDDLDTVKLRITNSARNLCEPIPSFGFHSFELSDLSHRVILVCVVNEQPRKPSLVRHRIYIRSGPSAQPADAEEIRRLVLG